MLSKRWGCYWLLPSNRAHAGVVIILTMGTQQQRGWCSHPEILSEGFTSVNSPGCHPSLPPTHTHPSLPFQHSPSPWVQLLHCWDWCNVKNERNQLESGWQPERIWPSSAFPPSPSSHFTLCSLSDPATLAFKSALSGVLCQRLWKIQMNDAVSPDTAKSIFYTFTVFDNFI